ncbi:MAG: cyclase [Nitriliruptorales bacterium]|nr:cyclase [Nitriliruptorales bacterium]
MKIIEKSVEVSQPVSTVYNQWTQFEEFPQFMEGVNKVRQLDDQHLHWETEIGLTEREFEAEITEQVPDQVVAWRALGETKHTGRVTFEKIDTDKTRVNVAMAYDPDGFVEKTGSAIGIVDKRVEGDLERFTKLIEQRGTETGAWRGEIHGGGSPSSLR